MAQLLHQTGIASSVEEGRKLTPCLVGGEVSYGTNLYLKFDSVKNAEEQEAYRIQAYGDD